MERYYGIIKKISIAAMCVALVLAAFGLFGVGRSDVALIEHSVIDEGILIKTGVTSSAGYIRSMKVKETEGDAIVEFYSTFGINNPNGAKSEFLLELNPGCERVLFRRGRHNYRCVLEKNQNGEWIRAEGRIIGE